MFCPKGLLAISWLRSVVFHILLVVYKILCRPLHMWLLICIEQPNIQSKQPTLSTTSCSSLTFIIKHFKLQLSVTDNFSHNQTTKWLAFPPPSPPSTLPPTARVKQSRRSDLSFLASRSNLPILPYLKTFPRRSTCMCLLRPLLDS